MSQTTQQPLPFSLSPAEPNLRDAFDLFKREILLGFNSHHLATIQSFDSANQTATATINYTKTIYVPSAGSNQYVPTSVPYPLLVDSPVICLGGGPGALTFPIEAGDECLVLFNDRDINNWFGTSTIDAPPLTGRLHSFSDGIILVGLRSATTWLDNYDTTRVCLRGSEDGQTVVGVGESLIKIANAGTTLNTLLQSLISQIEALVTATAAITVTGVTSGTSTSGVPSNAATISAIAVTLAATGLQIAGLLE